MTKHSQVMPMIPTTPSPDSDMVYREKPGANGKLPMAMNQQERLHEIDLRMNALMQELHFTLQPRLKVIAINPQLIADADIQIILLDG